MSEDKVDRIRFHINEVMKVLGLDMRDPNFTETPDRVARMYLEIFGGLEEDSEPEIKTFPNDQRYNNMITVKDIPFFSVCSHHLIPFFGRVHLGYIPGKQIIGLSKLARIVEFFAKRPQIQEQFTDQVIEFIVSKISPKGVMVVVEAQHLCMEMRGVEKPGALTVTSGIRGYFEDKGVREEFMDLISLRRERL